MRVLEFGKIELAFRVSIKPIDDVLIYADIARTGQVSKRSGTAFGVGLDFTILSVTKIQVPLISFSHKFSNFYNPDGAIDINGHQTDAGT